MLDNQEERWFLEQRKVELLQGIKDYCALILMTLVFTATIMAIRL